MTPIVALHEPPSEDWRPRAPQGSDTRLALLWLLEAVVAVAFLVPSEHLRSGSRCSADIAFARQAAMYLAHVALGLSYSAVGRRFGRDRTTAAHACRLVEERRDDIAVDRLFDMLEAVCTELVRPLRAAPGAQP